jgi:hypothetical protein
MTSHNWQPGDEAVVMTWDEGGEPMIGSPDVALHGARKQSYIVVGISEDELILVIPYDCSWSKPFNDKLFDYYVKNPKYRHEKFYLMPKEWAVDRIVKKDRYAPDGSQCHQCKDFVYMAEPNGATLGLPLEMFICRSCRHNESVMFMLRYDLGCKGE